MVSSAAEDDGIVCNGIQFYLRQLFEVQPGIAAGAMHLWHATEAVRILYAAAIHMALHDIGIVQQQAKPLCYELVAGDKGAG